MSLLSEAKAAYDAKLAEEAAVLEERRKTLRQAALNALKAVLVRPDGTALTLETLGMTLQSKDVNPDTGVGLVVWSDGTIAVGAQLVPGETDWRLRLVRQVDGGWAAVGDRRIRSLAELYAEHLTAG